MGGTNMKINRLEIQSLTPGINIPGHIFDMLSDALDPSAIMLRFGWSWELPEGCVAETTTDSLILHQPCKADVEISFSEDHTLMDPFKGFEGMLSEGLKVSVIIRHTDVMAEEDLPPIWIGDLVDTFIMDNSERDDRSPDEVISFREGRSCACIRRALVDDYIPSESIMMFDMRGLSPLERNILTAIFEDRRYES
jgi:hypothetical protein